MRIVVTGAAGLVGSHLAARLVGDGHHVLAVDSMTTGQPRNVDWLRGMPEVTWIEQDIAQPLEIEGGVDAVFNMACPASPVDFRPKALEIMRTCSEGVRRLLEFALEHEAIFLQASTSECYGDPEVNPQPESYRGNVSTIGVRSVYDEGKRFAEALTMAYHRERGVRTRIARIFNTYGPRMRLDDGRVLPNFLCQTLKGEPLTVYGEGRQTRSFCYVDDLVDGLVRLALESDFVEPVNLGNPDEVTIRQVAEEVIELTGSGSKIDYRPLPEDDPKLRQPDITRAREILGWSPTVDRRTGFLRTIEDFRQVLAMHPTDG
ncbi:MAG: SDR family oxidoreductase [Phycisphaerae bacterium]|nr:SDR family oxidoreductase [Phycisphaerae bacterium]